MTTDNSTDRIEKQITLKAPRSRVWRALTDPAELGAWFGARFEDVVFEPGATARGEITSPGHEGFSFEIVIDAVEPEHRFAFRWHPYAIDPEVDYSDEPMTLIAFELEEVPGGTRLTVVETGFDRIPLHRRAEARRMNEHGWEAQLGNIAKHVGGSA